MEEIRKEIGFFCGAQTDFETFIATEEIMNMHKYNTSANVTFTFLMLDAYVFKLL